jgi:radical SAM superfamily enzyme YgiQ (UPF0313 family)
LKTLLLNAPWSKDGCYGVRAGSRWPHLEDATTSGYMPFPFFMAYAAATLQRAGRAVTVIDACAEKLSGADCLERIRGASPDLVAMETATPTIDIDLAFASEVKKALGDIPIAFCGPHAPMLSADFLERNRQVDFVMQGEYELILSDLVTSLERNDPLEGVPGLMFRHSSGAVRNNGARPLLKNIDSLPWPARELFPMELYSDRPGGIPAPSLQMWASRGCPHQCIFCVWPQVMYGGPSYRVRNPKDVVDEIQHCLKKWPFKSFYFDDDTFNIGKTRILALCEEIRSRNIGLPWAVMARADYVDRELLIAMKSAGLVSLKYGVESAVQELVDASGKRLRLERVEEAVRLSKELGIDVHLTFSFGLPGETKETIRRTIRKAIELDPCSVQFSIITPFPGTTYYRELAAQGAICSKTWEDYSGSTGAVFETAALTREDLDQALKDAYAAWDLHRLISTRHWATILRQSLRHPLGSIRRLLSVSGYALKR